MEEIQKQAITQILNRTKPTFGTMSYLYTFTNENIKETLTYLQLENKDILTVTGSGDHVLNMLLYVDNIDTFDINLFAYYLLILKKYAILALEKDEFLDFFLNEKPYFDPKTFAKIKACWQEEIDALSFFEYLFHLPQSLYLKKTTLFTDNQLSHREEYMAFNSYLDDENYAQLKQTIMSKNIQFHHSNLKSLVLSKQFDYIHISNITDYLCNMFSGDILGNYKKFIYQKLYSMLKENGCLLSYLYDGKIAHFSESYVHDILHYHFKEEEVGKDKILIFEKKVS